MPAKVTHCPSAGLLTPKTNAFGASFFRLLS
jgi:hypothetical protein